jgi:phenylalanyl-tRNA synthetase beta chain
MKLSVKWLKDFVEVDDFLKDPAPLAKALTDAGLEVEEIVQESQNFNEVVVGKIEKLGRHPDADRLTYCDVRVSEDEILKIVCGAKNHKEGDKVCVAKVGAVLPGDFKIKKSKIRGVESFGMLCSKKELGLGEENATEDGILILPEDAPIGEDFSVYYGKDDVVLEINVTPNRADCLSHLGLAREVCVLFNRPLKKRDLTDLKKHKEERAIKIDLKEPDQCPRYLGCMVYDVQVKESPEWMVKRLESVGLSSINNIVDITNYVMMDSGQPLHAFDSEIISGNSVIIRKAQVGEAFKSLDGSEFKLSGDELVIADKDKCLALAGVVGGVNSGVSSKTSSIFLEAAYFTPETVRKTSRALGVDTDSAHRFSRGVDQSQTNRAMDMALSLLQDLAEGRVSEKVYETYPKPYKPAEIPVTLTFLSEKLGVNLQAKQVDEIFKQLGFEVSSTSEGDEWVVKPNAYRHDIRIKEDLAEEVGRLIGYDKIPETLPSVASAPQKRIGLFENFSKLKEHCVGLGFFEVIHHNFYGSVDEMNWHGYLKEDGLLKEGDSVKIKNPLSSETSLMRESLIPQFISNCIRNYRLGQYEGQIFEFGKTHYKVNGEFKESHVLSLGLWSKSLNQANTHKKLIGILEELFSLWNIKSYRLSERPTKSATIHPKLSADIVAEGKEIGLLYAPHPSVYKEQKLQVQFSGLEIDLDLLLKGQPRPKKFKDFSRQPVVERDFSFVIDESFDFSKIEKQIKGVSKDYFKDLSVVDEYRDEKLGEDKLSLTVRARFQAQDKTLGEEEVKTLHSKILDKLKTL